MNHQVFIASPSDCRQERSAARAAVGRVDRMIGRHLGHRLEAVGWETDTFPDARRPQEVINELLEASAIVIILFWHRFGTNAGTGQTGTVEEFYRSLQRRNRGAAPRILLYFKEVNEEQPPKGFQKSQYRRLKRFRSDLEKSRSVYFRLFSRTQEWAPQLEEALADELFRRWRAATAPRNSEATDSSFLQDYIESLTAQLERLTITGEEPRAIERLRAEILRLKLLAQSKGW